jgi:malate/lactate dehydrogenase
LPECMAFASRFGRGGVARTIEIQLTPDEIQSFRHSADVVAATLHSVRCDNELAARRNSRSDPCATML